MWQFALKALFGWIADWFSGFLQRRKLQQETQRADVAESHVQQDQQIIQSQKSRNETDQAIDSAGVDAAKQQLRNDGFNQP